jgi:hypothetical protein
MESGTMKKLFLKAKCLALSALLGGLVCIVLSIQLKDIWLFRVGYFSIILLSPGFALIFYYYHISYSKGGWRTHKGVVVLSLLLVLLLLFGVLGLIKVILPYLYTPSAITKSNIEVYRKCIELVNHEPYVKKFTIGGWLRTTDGRYNVLHKEGLKEASDTFSYDFIVQLRKLSVGMERVGCHDFEIMDGFVVFRTYPPRVLPSRPGVVFSIGGNNPEQNIILERFGPFIGISENWYISKKLIVCGARYDKAYELPDSIIDRSANVKP